MERPKLGDVLYKATTRGGMAVESYEIVRVVEAYSPSEYGRIHVWEASVKKDAGERIVAVSESELGSPFGYHLTEEDAKASMKKWLEEKLAYANRLGW